jgi:hypothetical protein
MYVLGEVLPQTHKINYCNALSSPTWSGGSASGRGRSDWNVSRACHDAGCRGFASCNEGGINGTPLGRRGTCAQQADAAPASQRMKRPLSFHLALSVSLFMSEGGYASVCTHSAQFNLPRREFNYWRAHLQTYTRRKVKSNLMEVMLW